MRRRRLLANNLRGWTIHHTMFSVWYPTSRGRASVSYLLDRSDTNLRHSEPIDSSLDPVRRLGTTGKIKYGEGQVNVLVQGRQSLYNRAGVRDQAGVE